MKFRILTYNIRHGGVGRSDSIASVIKSCAPDLVLLQEATDQSTLQQIAEAAGMADARTYRRQSLGFLSRLPVAFCQWIRPRISRHAFVEVVPAGGKFRVFGVHLSAVYAAWTEQRRVLELRALLNSIAQHRDGFHVLTGDFNTAAPGGQLALSRGSVRRTIQTIIDAGYVDAFRSLHPKAPGSTLPTKNPHLRLDYVFVPSAYSSRVRACDVVRDPAAVGASDHFPVFADFQVAT